VSIFKNSSPRESARVSVSIRVKTRVVGRMVRSIGSCQFSYFRFNNWSWVGLNVLGGEGNCPGGETIWREYVRGGYSLL